VGRHVMQMQPSPSLCMQSNETARCVCPLIIIPIVCALHQKNMCTYLPPHTLEDVQPQIKAYDLP